MNEKEREQRKVNIQKLVEKLMQLDWLSLLLVDSSVDVLAARQAAEQRPPEPPQKTA